MRSFNIWSLRTSTLAVSITILHFHFTECVMPARSGDGHHRRFGVDDSRNSHLEHSVSKLRVELRRLQPRGEKHRPEERSELLLRHHARRLALARRLELGLPFD